MTKRIEELTAAGKDSLAIEAQGKLAKLKSAAKAASVKLGGTNDVLTDLGDEVTDYATDSGEVVT